LISQKDYVPFGKLPRWIIGLGGNMMKICTGRVEVSQTGIWLDRQEGKCFGSEVYLKNSLPSLGSRRDASQWAGKAGWLCRISYLIL